MGHSTCILHYSYLPFVPHRCLVLALPYPTSKRSRKNHPPTYRPADHQLATTPSKTPEPYTEFDDTRDESTNSFTEAALSKLLGVSTNSSRRSMDRGATQYSQSESADHASAAHYTPEVRSNNYSTSATPTSEYGIYPTSARSGSSQNTYNASIIHPATTAVATEEVWLNQQIHPLLRPARPTPNTTANTAHTLSKVICRTAILNTPPAAPCTHNLDPTGLVMPEDNTPCTADIRSVEPRHLPLQPLLERVLVKFTRSSPFLVLNNTSVHAEDTRKSSACTSAAGTVAKRPTAH